MYIYGRKPVAEALIEESTTVEKIYIRNSLNKNQVKAILQNASRQKVPVSEVPGKKLYDLVGSVNDQGVVALLSEADYMELDEWLTAMKDVANPALLLVDGVEDTHNIGAIIRSAAGAGMHGILLPKHGIAPITGGTYKAAAGNIGKVPLIRAGNLNQAIMELKEHYFWIAGLDGEGETGLWNLDMSTPMAFIIGAEQDGIRPSTKKHCDFLVNIPLSNGVESLNASVAAALLAFEWKRRRGQS